MKVRKIKDEHDIIQVSWITDIFEITEEELFDAFDERWPDNAPHDWKDLEYVYPLKDAVQLAIEQVDGEYAVKLKNDWRVKVVEISEEEEEIDWI